MSVVFDFIDSLNDVAPVSPMLLPVGKCNSMHDTAILEFQSCNCLSHV